MPDLTWLSGEWTGDVWGGRMVELWSAFDGGTSLAYNRLIKNGVTAHKEFIWIDLGPPVKLSVHVFREPEETIVYELVESGAHRAVFENQNHVRLQRMTYKRAGSFLTILLEGDRKGGRFQEEIVLMLAEPISQPIT